MSPAPGWSLPVTARLVEVGLSRVSPSERLLSSGARPLGWLPTLVAAEQCSRHPTVGCREPCAAGSPAGLGAHEGGLSRVSGLQVGCRGGSCALPAGQGQSPSSSSSYGVKHAKELLLVLKAENTCRNRLAPNICSHRQHNPMLYLSLCLVSSELGGERRKEEGLPASEPPVRTGWLCSVCQKPWEFHCSRDGVWGVGRFVPL
ncbi:uncharacterized protein LOC117067539 [Trachypithecus francoisi]|uniref:uncharacterized protein LOC117067539 n=1 Tax=Trachypithecus francoisi TaxID=54180 RepID=UPI00141B6EA0|nr:uncharacterized protein LOC117067539 [Trachypithecus francoisi]